MVSARWSGVWLLLAAACGGSVERGSSDPDGNSVGETVNSESQEGDADIDLGSCQLGRKEDFRDSCPWVADGRCYDDRAMACNCACPRSGNSQCVSGFDDGPDGHVWVSCD